MPTTEYKNHICEMKIVSAVPVPLLPEQDRTAKDILGLIARLHTEAGVHSFKAEEVAGPVFTTEVEHHGGTYKDQGELIDDKEHITWPDAIGDPYRITEFTNLMVIRAALVKVLRQFEPSLVEIEFTA